jgi:hypothetical protein
MSEGRHQPVSPGFLVLVSNHQTHQGFGFSFRAERGAFDPPEAELARFLSFYRS